MAPLKYLIIITELQNNIRSFHVEMTTFNTNNVAMVTVTAWAMLDYLDVIYFTLFIIY